MGYFKNKWEQKVRDYCDSQYELINVEPGDINFYYKCHLVATHYAVKNNHEKIALVMYRENGLCPSVHFINFDGKKFIDNSIGHWVKTFEHRFVRFISKDEFFKTPTILTDTKRFFRDMAGPFTRTFCDISN